jgi:hypothetical protein
MVTGNYSTPKYDSVVFASDTVTGFPEYAYWKIALFNPTILNANN